MTADGLQVLDTKKIDAILAQAEAEKWTKLALLGPSQKHFAERLVAQGWRNEGWHIFALEAPLIDISNKIIENRSLIALILRGNILKNKGAVEISNMKNLEFLDLNRNQIEDIGATAISSLPKIKTLELGGNLIADQGADAIRSCKTVLSIDLFGNQIGHSGCIRLIDFWADPSFISERKFLDLRNNPGFNGLQPNKALTPNDAQFLKSRYWPEFQDYERISLPEPDAAGGSISFGVQVAILPDQRLTLTDQPSSDGARDDAVGRELHSEVILALDELIRTAGRSNSVAEWREAAEAAKNRLGSGPREVRVSAILRIERLRSLREADERRRLAPDPLVEPAEAGVAAALRDAVAAANLYIETDPNLAEQQRQLADPGLDLAISAEEATAAEAEMSALDIADPALLAELRLGRETAEAGGGAGDRALAWLAGSWRNVVREMLRQVLAWVREQVKAARASADETAMQAKLGKVITIDEAVEVLAAMGLRGKNAAAAATRAGMAALRRTGRAFATGAGVTAGSVAVVGMVAFLEQQFALLARLGWQADFTALLARVLGL